MPPAAPWYPRTSAPRPSVARSPVAPVATPTSITPVDRRPPGRPSGPGATDTFPCRRGRHTRVVRHLASGRVRILGGEVPTRRADLTSPQVPCSSRVHTFIRGRPTRAKLRAGQQTTPGTRHRPRARARRGGGRRGWCGGWRRRQKWTDRRRPPAVATEGHGERAGGAGNGMVEERAPAGGGIGGARAHRRGRGHGRPRSPRPSPAADSRRPRSTPHAHRDRDNAGGARRRGGRGRSRRRAAPEMDQQPTHPPEFVERGTSPAPPNRA